MKKSLLKVSFISILATIICGSVFAAGRPCPDVGHILYEYSPGYYTEGCDVPAKICLQGHYCPGAGWAISIVQNLYPCPSNYDNTAEGLTSIEECCLNGYDSNTGLCIESSESTPSRTPRRIAKDDTNPVCDDTTLGTTSGSTDFEADWTPNTINITWVGNGAMVSGGASTCTYDQSFNLPTPPERTGYTFDGWKVVNK